MATKTDKGKMKDQSNQKNGLNKAVRLLRIYNDMRAVELSEKIGISSAVISDMENFKKVVSANIVQKYADEFNVKPSFIFSFAEKLEENEVAVKQAIARAMIEAVVGME